MMVTSAHFPVQPAVDSRQTPCAGSSGAVSLLRGRASPSRLCIAARVISRLPTAGDNGRGRPESPRVTRCLGRQLKQEYNEPQGCCSVKAPGQEGGEQPEASLPMMVSGGSPSTRRRKDAEATAGLGAAELYVVETRHRDGADPQGHTERKAVRKGVHPSDRGAEPHAERAVRNGGIGTTCQTNELHQLITAN